jgi:uncharacterized membrane protein
MLPAPRTSNPEATHVPAAGTSSVAASSVPPAVPPAVPSRSKVPAWRDFTLPGCWGALFFACMSFTPSLVPRSGLVQGVVCGISAAIGYGLGVWAAAVWRAYADRGPRPARRWAWRTFLISAAVLLVVFFFLGQSGQHELRVLLGVSQYSIPLAIASPFLAALIFVLLVRLGRGLRWLYRRLARLLQRWIGPRAANMTGWITVVVVAYLVVSGVLLNGLVAAANAVFSTRDTTTAQGVHQPTTSLRSGGTGSRIRWDTLGWQGRTFTATGPTAREIANTMHVPAREPIRAYAGLASARDTEARAALAVDDLARAGGFQRKNLLVVTTTGSGWVNASNADTGS